MTQIFTSAEFLNSGQLSGLRNRIINGDMRIDQRNSGASQTITTTGSYCIDRMYVIPTGASVTGQRIAGSGVDQYQYKITGAASVTNVIFGQRIEATNIYDLASTTATLSVELASNALTTVTWTAYYPTTADTWPTVTGSSGGGTKNSIATGTFTVTSTLATYSVQIALGSNITAGLAIELSVGALVATDTWTIGQFQLVPGTAAQPFERTPIGTQLALSQRYFPCYNWVSGTEPIGFGYSTTTTSTFIGFPLSVTPRVNITGVTVSALTNVLLHSGTNATGQPTSVAFSTASQSNVSLIVTTTSGTPTLTAGQASYMTATGTTQIQFTGAEL